MYIQRMNVARLKKIDDKNFFETCSNFRLENIRSKQKIPIPPLLNG